MSNDGNRNANEVLDHAEAKRADAIEQQKGTGAAAQERNSDGAERQKSNVAAEEQASNGESPEQTSRKRRKKLLLIGGAALIFAIGAAYFLYNSLTYESTDDATVGGHVMPLSARINGHVLEVRVVEGQLVHAGDVLAVIDPRDYQIAVEQATANLRDVSANASGANLSYTELRFPWRARRHNPRFSPRMQAFRPANRHSGRHRGNLLQTQADLRSAATVKTEDISRQQYDQAQASASANRAAVLQ